MNTLTRRSADAYVEANRVVTDFSARSPISRAGARH